VEGTKFKSHRLKHHTSNLKHLRKRALHDGRSLRATTPF
jgi:hypothetical protein